MSSAELNEIKLSLISWINQLKDENLISFIDGIRNSRSNNDWWDELSEDQKKNIFNGLKDAEGENLISSEEFWEKLKSA